MVLYRLYPSLLNVLFRPTLKYLGGVLCFALITSSADTRCCTVKKALDPESLLISITPLVFEQGVPLSIC
jgi:hypothetical protein